MGSPPITPATARRATTPSIERFFSSKKSRNITNKNKQQQQEAISLLDDSENENSTNGISVAMTPSKRQRRRTNNNNTNVNNIKRRRTTSTGTGTAAQPLQLLSSSEDSVSHKSLLVTSTSSNRSTTSASIVEVIGVKKPGESTTMISSKPTSLAASMTSKGRTSVSSKTSQRDRGRTTIPLEIATRTQTVPSKRTSTSTVPSSTSSSKVATTKTTSTTTTQVATPVPVARKNYHPPPAAVIAPKKTLPSTTKTPTATSASLAAQQQVQKTTPSPTKESTIGLLRIPRPLDAPTSLTLDDTTAHPPLFYPLFVGGTIGRNTPRPKSTRIDVGIEATKDNDGISREHVQIQQIHSTYILVKVKGTFVGQYHYQPQKQKMHSKIVLRPKDTCFKMYLGDVLLMDEFRRCKATEYPPPNFFFRVVSSSTVSSKSTTTTTTTTRTTMATRTRTRTRMAKELPKSTTHKPIAATATAATTKSKVINAPLTDKQAKMQQQQHQQKSSSPTSIGKLHKDDGNMTMELTEEMALSILSDENKNASSSCSSKKRSSVPVDQQPGLDGNASTSSSPSLTKVAKIVPSKVDCTVLSPNNHNNHKVEPRTNKQNEVVVEESSVSSTPATRETVKDIPPPVVGERFWIQFQKVENRFGTNMPACLGATVLEVTPKKVTAAKATKNKTNQPTTLYGVKVIFDDNNTDTIQELDFPSEDIYRLRTKPSDTNANNNNNNSTNNHENELIYYAQPCHPSQKESPWSRIAYTECPQEIYLGDLVDCHYQNGGYRNGWFRGRVASVSVDKASCDVAYDDGEFECGIPIHKGKIRLLERGCEQCRWLSGLPVETEVQTGRSKTDTTVKKGRIEQVRQDNGELFFKIDKRSKKKRPYVEIETFVFDAERQKSFHGDKINIWPGLSLEIGDIVYALFQKGKPDNIWYRGRIAAIHHDNEHDTKANDIVESKRFDICYDEIDFYECGVPLEYLRLFKQHRMGEESWVSGLEVPKKGKGRRGNKNGKVGTAMEPFEVHFSDGQIESWTYSEVATAWFATQKRKKKVKKFPGQRKKKINQNVARHKKEEKKEEAPQNVPRVDHDQNPMSQEDNCDASIDVDDDEDEDTTKNEFKEMNQPVANSLWRALNSAEPQVGAGLLSHITSFHKKVPNNNFCKNLSDLMTHGPKSEGVAFIDPNRVELAYNYFQTLSTNSLIMDHVSDNMTSTSWHDFEIALNRACSQEVYRIKGDSSRMTTLALGRIGESLQVAACSIEFVLAQFQHQLKECIKPQDGSNGGCGSYRTKALVKLVLQNDTRDVLKKVSRIYAQAWIQNGHFIISDAALFDIVHDGPDTNGAIQVCAQEAKRCLGALGKVVSYIAWLYCAEEGIKQGSDSCAFLIKDAIFIELDNFDPSPFLPPAKGREKSSQNSDYVKKLKLKFTLGLQDDFASPLRHTLAKMLGVSKQIDILSV